MLSLLNRSINEATMNRCASREELSLEQDALTSAVLAAGAEGKQPKPQDIAAPPCFFANLCQQRAALEKAGRSVCRECAKARLRGSEYPLRASGREPLYFTGRSASEALDMMEDVSQRARRRLRGGTWS